MEYFTLQPDERVVHAIVPLGVPKVIPGASGSRNQESGNGAGALPVQYNLKESPDQEYVDLLATPLWLVSNRLKQILAKYQPDLRFWPVMLADQSKMRQDLYWQMTVPPVECLARQSEFNKNGTVAKVVIDQAKAKDAKVFTVSRLKEPLLLVDLDVAESILRRDFSGIRLNRVALSQKAL